MSRVNPNPRVNPPSPASKPPSPTPRINLNPRVNNPGVDGGIDGGGDGGGGVGEGGAGDGGGDGGGEGGVEGSVEGGLTRGGGGIGLGLGSTPRVVNPIVSWAPELVLSAPSVNSAPTIADSHSDPDLDGDSQPERHGAIWGTGAISGASAISGYNSGPGPAVSGTGPATSPSIFGAGAAISGAPQLTVFEAFYLRHGQELFLAAALAGLLVCTGCFFFLALRGCLYRRRGYRGGAEAGGERPTARVVARRVVGRGRKTGLRYNPVGPLEELPQRESDV